MQGSYTGNILNNQVLLLNQLRQQSVVMVNTLHNFTVHGASVSRNGQRAEVRVTELEHQFHERDGTVRVPLS